MSRPGGIIWSPCPGLSLGPSRGSNGGYSTKNQTYGKTTNTRLCSEEQGLDGGDPQKNLL